MPWSSMCFQIPSTHSRHACRPVARSLRAVALWWPAGTWKGLPFDSSRGQPCGPAIDLLRTFDVRWLAMGESNGAGGVRATG